MKKLATSVALSALFVIARAEASTLMVGPGEPYALPSDAAAAAAPGDTISIAAGHYTDCAVWLPNNLTIVGAGESKTIIGNADCWGKGVFVVYSNNAIIRGLSLVNAVVADQNGAGIRAEGTNLLIQHVRFSHNQDGILGDPVAGSTIIIEYSDFEKNGFCGNISCSHGVYIDNVAKLVIRHSTFNDTQIAHDIKSRAAATVVTDNIIEDGPNGTSSYLIDLPNAGNILIQGNMLEKGPLSSNHTAAISIGEEGNLYPKSPIRVYANTFENDCCSTAFVYNYTPYPASLVSNTLQGQPAVPLLGPGTVH